MKNILDIVDRVKLVKRLVNDGDVALLLNMSKGALSAHKKRGSIPYEVLSTFCEQEGISFDWLLTGEGPKERGQIKEPAQTFGQSEPTDPKLAALVKKLETIYREGSRKDRIEARVTIEEIYNDITEGEEIKKPEGVEVEESLKKAGNR